MTVDVLPDVEQIVIDYLRASGEVGAQVGDRIFMRLPPNWSAPAVTVQRLGGPVAVPRRLDAARIQIDVWGGTPLACHAAARVIRAAMWEAHKQSHALGVVTGVEEELGPAWLPEKPDPKKAPVSRYTQTFTVYAHPL